MIIKILGILDILVALIFWFVAGFHVTFLNGILLIMGLFLLIKGVIFVTSLNLVSSLDIVSALIIIASTSIQMPKIIIVIVVLFLIQKGILSFWS